MPSEYTLELLTGVASVSKGIQVGPRSIFLVVSLGSGLALEPCHPSPTEDSEPSLHTAAQESLTAAQGEGQSPMESPQTSEGLAASFSIGTNIPSNNP